MRLSVQPRDLTPGGCAQNGRVRDTILRLEAAEEELSCPHDAEVSIDELEFLCEAAKSWKKGGATRRVRLTEHKSMVPVGQAAKDQKKAGKRRAPPKKGIATVTRVFIEQLGSDGQITP